MFYKTGYSKKRRLLAECLDLHSFPAPYLQKLLLISPLVVLNQSFPYGGCTDKEVKSFCNPNHVPDGGQFPEKKGGEQMDYGNGTRFHRNFIAGMALVAAISVAAPCAAAAGWLADFHKRNTATSHEQTRSARMEAVENANAAFVRAREAGAERHAPYEYYTAEEFLKLAMEELSSGDKIGVALFAAESEKYSFEAMEKAGGGGK
jgi:Domain of unknown function (DUF4398)